MVLSKYSIFNICLHDFLDGDNVTVPNIASFTFSDWVSTLIIRKSVSELNNYFKNDLHRSIDRAFKNLLKVKGGWKGTECKC